MKRIILAIAAITAIAACTKSEVTYEAPGEIGFAPVTGNITKASGKAGDLYEGQKLGIYAFWNANGAVETASQSGAQGVSNYSLYSDPYLVNALFAKRKDITSWGGSPTGHPWPVNGALVFAGYTTPGDVVLTPGTSQDEPGKVMYDLASDTMTFTGYDNSNEFDLCWFGRTKSSYNNRTNTSPISVTLSHALSWITIAAYAEGTAKDWIITSMEWKVPTSGTAKCVGTSATWESLVLPDAATNILESEHELTAGTTSGGKTTGETITNNLVIPTTPVDLKITYTFPVNGIKKTDSKTVSLKLNQDNSQKWVSGIHYTYTLKFAANEILVAPSYGTWTSPADQGVTVE